MLSSVQPNTITGTSLHRLSSSTATTSSVPAHRLSPWPSQLWTTTGTSVETVVFPWRFVLVGLAVKSLDSFICWYVLCRIHKCCVLMDISVLAWNDTIVVPNGGMSLIGCPVNRCLLIMSKLSVGVCRHSIWASSTNNSTLSQPPPSSMMPTNLAHHHHQ